MANNVYEIVTQKILDQLEVGVVPWRKPWAYRHGSLPYNVKNKKAYRGINLLLLSVNSYNQSGWLTFKQSQELGGTIRKGEKGSMVVFFKINEYEKENEKTGELNAVKYPVLRYYTVFNLEQTEGLEKYFKTETESKFNNIEECENVLHDYLERESIKLYHTGNQAFYMPSTDSITLPCKDSFDNEPSYYSTAFHEATHSTGCESRLSRFSNTARPSSESYSKEELVAEIGACFALAHCGIEPIYDNSAAYIKAWTDRLKNDSRLIVCAANKAQKACDLILNIKPEQGKGDNNE